MRPLLTLLITLFLLSCMVSCKKTNSSPGGGAGSVLGNWEFLFLTAQTQASVSVSGVTDTTKSSYTTTNNSGTIGFTADSMVVTNLSYSANFTATAYLYVGTTFLDSASMTFSESIPATNGSWAYKQVGNDSLYFPGGFTAAGAAGGSSGGMLTAGGRYVINNDTLKLHLQASGNVQGLTEEVNETIYLLKQ